MWGGGGDGGWETATPPVSQESRKISHFPLNGDTRLESKPLRGTLSVGNASRGSRSLSSFRRHGPGMKESKSLASHHRHTKH